MFVQGQFVQKAMNPHVPETATSVNQSVTVANLSAELSDRFFNFDTRQRANTVLILWGAEETEDTRALAQQIKQLISELASDDPHHSARFALALEFTFNHIDDLGLASEKCAQLRGTLNSTGRDFDSTAEEVRTIIGESLKNEEIPEVQADAGSAQDGNLFESRFISSVPSPVVTQSQPTDPQPSVISETPREQSVVRASRSKKCSERRPEPLVKLDTESSCFNGEGRVSIRRSVKSRLSSMAGGVQDAFSFAHNELSSVGRKLKSSLGELAAKITNKVSTGVSRLGDAAITAADVVRDAFKGKAVARLKSSANRIVDTTSETAKVSEKVIAKGLNKAAHAIGEATMASGRAIAFAGRVAAHGVAHGAKAIGTFIAKGAAWIGNRLSGLRGFERV